MSIFYLCLYLYLYLYLYTYIHLRVCACLRVCVSEEGPARSREGAERRVHAGRAMRGLVRLAMEHS